MSDLIIMTLVAFVVAVISERKYSGRVGRLGNPIPNVMAFIVPAVMFTVYSGLRTRCGDTFFYIHSYELLPDDMARPEFNFGGNQLFQILQWVCRRTTDDPQLFLFICAAISLIPILFILYKYSCPFDMSLFLFVATGYFALSMNGMRQYVAAGVMILGTKYLFAPTKGNWYKYFLIAGLAYLFHSSALIMIPIYIIVRRKAWSPLTFVIIVGSVLGLVMFDEFLPSFLSTIEDTGYNNYVQNGWFVNGEESGASISRVAVMAVPVVLSYMARGRLKILGKAGDILVNLAVINLAFSIFALYNWIFVRFTIYLGAYFIILIAWLVTRGFDRKNSKIVYVLCVVMFCFYFWNMKYAFEDYWSPYFH